MFVGIFEQHKMTGGVGGGAERVAHINSPPALVPRLTHTSWYMSDHYICLQYLPGCSLIRIVSSTTPVSVSLVHGFTHDKSVPCSFSTCLDFFFGGSCEDIVRLSILTRKNLSFTPVQ